MVNALTNIEQKTKSLKGKKAGDFGALALGANSQSVGFQQSMKDELLSLVSLGFNDLASPATNQLGIQSPKSNAKLEVFSIKDLRNAINEIIAQKNAIDPQVSNILDTNLNQLKLNSDKNSVLNSIDGSQVLSSGDLKSLIASIQATENMQNNLQVNISNQQLNTKSDSKNGIIQKIDSFVANNLNDGVTNISSEKTKTFRQKIVENYFADDINAFNDFVKSLELVETPAKNEKVAKPTKKTKTVEQNNFIEFKENSFAKINNNDKANIKIINSKNATDIIKDPANKSLNNIINNITDKLVNISDNSTVSKDKSNQNTNNIVTNNLVKDSSANLPKLDKAAISIQSEDISNLADTNESATTKSIGTPVTIIAPQIAKLSDDKSLSVDKVTNPDSKTVNNQIAKNLEISDVNKQEKNETSTGDKNENLNFNQNLSHVGQNKIRFNTSDVQLQKYTSIPLDQVPSTTLKAVDSTPDGGMSMVRMVLTPDSLGTVFVEISMNNNNAKLSFRADNKDAIAAIENQIDGLQASLKDKGINTESLIVDYKEHISKDSATDVKSDGNRDNNFQNQNSNQDQENLNRQNERRNQKKYFFSVPNAASSSSTDNITKVQSLEHEERVNKILNSFLINKLYS